MLTLWNESIWTDEGFSALAVMKSFKEMMGIVMRDTAPPGFYFIGWLWVRIFGNSEVALRSLSLLLILGAAFFGALLVYHFGKNKLLAILAFILCFFNPFSFAYAFEFRMYALLAFATMGSIYFFVTKKWWPFIGITLLALYTQHFALFTVAAEVVIFLIEKIKLNKNKINFKELIKSLWPFWVIGLLYLPWVYPLYLQTTRVQDSGFWIPIPKINDFKNLVLKFIMVDGAGIWTKVSWILTVIILLLKDWKKYFDTWWKILLLLFSSAIFSFGLSFVMTPIFFDRYLLSIAVGMGVLLVLGSKKKAMPFLIILAAIYLYFSFFSFVHPNKDNFRDLADFIKTEKKSDDLLINYNGKNHRLWESKYYGLEAPIYIPEGELPLYVGTAQMVEGDKLRVLPDNPSRILVITSEKYEEVELDGPWVKYFQKEFGKLRVIYFRKSILL